MIPRCVLLFPLVRFYYFFVGFGQMGVDCLSGWRFEDFVGRSHHLLNLSLGYRVLLFLLFYLLLYLLTRVFSWSSTVLYDQSLVATYRLKICSFLERYFFLDQLHQLASFRLLFLTFPLCFWRTSFLTFLHFLFDIGQSKTIVMFLEGLPLIGHEGSSLKIVETMSLSLFGHPIDLFGDLILVILIDTH